MKKRIIISLMAIAFTVTVLSGCRKHGHIAADSAAADVTEAETLPDRMSPENGTVIYSAYSDYRDLYNFEPLFNDSDWMDKDGRLLYPYRNITSKGFKIGDIFAMFYMSEEVASKATSEDLLTVVTDAAPTSMIVMANSPCEMAQMCSNKLLAANELLHRPDMARVVLKDYRTREYTEPEKITSNNAIQIEEMWLGSNLGYTELDDDERAEVLELAAGNMSKIQELGLETTINDNCFLGLAAQEYKQNGNGWYDYIMDNADQTIKDAFNECLKWY
ncbi:MAG: hypothetical protein PUB17_05835 [Lachnospiraceae bacterium]|nr:hypothetical protein [Lachnospiraceae bacterium]